MLSPQPGSQCCGFPCPSCARGDQLPLFRARGRRSRLRAFREAALGVICPSPAATWHRYHHPDPWALGQGAPLPLPGDSQDDSPGVPGTRHEPLGPSPSHPHPDPRDPRAAPPGLAPHLGVGASPGAFWAQPHGGDPLGAASPRPRPEWGRPRVRARGRCGPLAHKGGGGKAGRGGPGAGAAGRGGGRAGGDKAPATAAAGWRSEADRLLGLPGVCRLRRLFLLVRRRRRRRSPSSASPPRRHPASARAALPPVAAN